MAPNHQVGQARQVSAPKKPRDMAIVSVSLIAISLTWAGTHQMGLAHMSERFSALEWGLAVALLIAGGFLFASLLIPVDIRQRMDFWTFIVIGGVPTAVLAYGVYAEAVGPLRAFDKVFGWAIPYGHVAMGVIIGVALAAAVQVRPPAPVVTEESLSVLVLPDS